MQKRRVRVLWQVHVQQSSHADDLEKCWQCGRQVAWFVAVFGLSAVARQPCLIT
jgi:hypothetical protein